MHARRLQMTMPMPNTTERANHAAGSGTRNVSSHSAPTYSCTPAVGRAQDVELKPWRKISGQQCVGD